MKLIFNLTSIAFILFAVLSSSGCNTASGFGKDLERGGQAIQNVATPEKNKTR